MSSANDLPVLHFPDQGALEAWLEDNHSRDRGIWLKLAKKASAHQSVTHAEAVEAGLCFGWIDGLARTIDDDFWMIRFTPRTRRSKWSQINCETATRLEAEGRIRPSGRAAIDAAKADGRWDRAYASPKNMTVPDDLQERLDANLRAREAFENLNASNRFAILVRIHDAVRPETRERRIEKFVAMLERGEKIY